MAVDLQELHDEIENDPQGIGYKTGAVWKGDAEIAGLINDPINGATIERTLVQPRELVEQIHLADWQALTDGEQRYLDLVLEGVEEINTQTGITEVRASILALFGAGTTTRNNIITVVQRQGSRAEVLWGEDTVVSVSNVGHAANL